MESDDDSTSTIDGGESMEDHLPEDEIWEEITDEYPSNAVVHLNPFPLGGDLTRYLQSCPGYGELVNLMFVKRLVCSSGSDCSVYVLPACLWMPLRSPDACKYLASILGYENVSVNFVTAVSPWFTFIEQAALKRKEPTLSVNIGKIRFSVSTQDRVVHYVMAEGITQTSNVYDAGEAERIASSYCVSPIINTHCPTRIPVTNNCTITKIIMNVMDKSSFEVLMWRLGAVHIMSADHIGRVNSDISDEELLHISMSRLVVYGDVSIKEGKINDRCLKTIFGGDSRSGKYGLLRIVTDGIYATNFKYDTIVELAEVISEDSVIVAETKATGIRMKAIRGIQPIMLLYEGGPSYKWAPLD
ncbi:UNVERIFIED_CONTAM: hypothetical protein HDU68_009575 [Siphonaria sp. JEL0065]|nr:hypothetical protein HDU68_009575 [Siphonaria sp. JEL0065]